MLQNRSSMRPFATIPEVVVAKNYIAFLEEWKHRVILNLNNIEVESSHSDPSQRESQQKIISELKFALLVEIKAHF